MELRSKYIADVDIPNLRIPACERCGKQGAHFCIPEIVDELRRSEDFYELVRGMVQEEALWDIEKSDPSRDLKRIQKWATAPSPSPQLIRAYVTRELGTLPEDLCEHTDDEPRT